MTRCDARRNPPIPTEEIATHAWHCESLEGFDALHWRELPTPEPRPGEVRIAVQAASLSFPDLLVSP